MQHIESVTASCASSRPLSEAASVAATPSARPSRMSRVGLHGSGAASRIPSRTPEPRPVGRDVNTEELYNMVFRRSASPPIADDVGQYNCTDSGLVNHTMHQSSLSGPRPCSEAVTFDAAAAVLATAETSQDGSFRGALTQTLMPTQDLSAIVRESLTEFLPGLVQQQFRLSLDSVLQEIRDSKLDTESKYAALSENVRTCGADVKASLTPIVEDALTLKTGVQASIAAVQRDTCETIMIFGKTLGEKLDQVDTRHADMEASLKNLYDKLFPIGEGVLKVNSDHCSTHTVLQDIHKNILPLCDTIHEGGNKAEVQLACMATALKSLEKRIDPVVEEIRKSRTDIFLGLGPTFDGLRKDVASLRLDVANGLKADARDEFEPIFTELRKLARDVASTIRPAMAETAASTTRMQASVDARATAGERSHDTVFGCQKDSAFLPDGAKASDRIMALLSLKGATCNTEVLSSPPVTNVQATGLYGTTSGNKEISLPLRSRSSVMDAR